MADKKTVPTNPDAKVTAEDEDEDKAPEQTTEAHPGFKRYRRTRQFGG
jgi:hypothetical protein